MSKQPGIVCNDDDRFLHCTSGDVCGPVKKVASIHLSGARNPKGRGSRTAGGMTAAEGKVRKIFDGSEEHQLGDSEGSHQIYLHVSAVGKGHEWQERPVIIGSWISPVFDTKPSLQLWSSMIALVYAGLQ